MPTSPFVGVKWRRARSIAGYIATSRGGPSAPARANHDWTRDATLTPPYYARVTGDRVIDTGIRQYTIHTQSGIETSREESGAYNALAIGKHFLVVRTAGDESATAEGKLAPWPDGLENQLFDSRES